MFGKFVQPGSGKQATYHVSKIMRPLRLKPRLGVGQQATKDLDRGGVFYIIGFPPFGGTRNLHAVVRALPHKLLNADKICFSSPRMASKFFLAKFQVCCTYHHPRRTHLHNRAGVRAGNFENDFYKFIKGTRVLSV